MWSGTETRSAPLPKYTEPTVCSPDCSIRKTGLALEVSPCRITKETVSSLRRILRHLKRKSPDPLWLCDPSPSPSWCLQTSQPPPRARQSILISSHLSHFAFIVEETPR